jgi:hypothetical protein
VKPPGRGYRGDWHWWIATGIFLVSVWAIFVALQLLFG